MYGHDAEKPRPSLLYKVLPDFRYTCMYWIFQMYGRDVGKLCATVNHLIELTIYKWGMQAADKWLDDIPLSHTTGIIIAMVTATQTTTSP